MGIAKHIREHIALHTPRTLLSCGVPILVPSSGSFADNGELSGITALPVALSEGSWAYFPANAIYAGSAAGIYWLDMSTTSAGTVYNNTYVPGSTSFDEPTTLVPFSCTGPGAYTQTTAAQITLLSYSMPAETVRIGGSVEFPTICAFPSSANSKLQRWAIGSSGVSKSNNTTGQYGRRDNPLWFRQHTSRYYRHSGSTGVAANEEAATALHGASTVDYSAALTVTHTIELAAAADWYLLMWAQLRVQ
jgi:hypothetical protein